MASALADALDGIQGRNLVDHGMQRWGLGRVALPYAVRNGQAFIGLHDAKHDLASDAAVLGHAELADLARHRAVPFDANASHVVEHDRQVLVAKRVQHRRQGSPHRLIALDQGVHGAQQAPMGDRGVVHPRHTGAFEPAQQSLGVERAVSVAQNPAERLVPAQLVPQRVQLTDFQFKTV